MNNLLKYKEFFGDVEFSDDCLHGKIIGINDLITYESENIAGLKKAFEEAVDDYLEMCKSIGKAPEKSYRGTFNIRIDPDLHRAAAIYAAAHQKSLNAVVEDALKNMIQGVGQ